jgi:DSF synthase
MQAVFRARQFIHPVTRAELDGIVELWIDAAMRLGERDLKMMNRLVRAQMRRMDSCAGEPELSEHARPQRRTC